MRVVAVGGVNADVTVAVEQRAMPGETVVGRGPRWSRGGKGANIAVAAARAAAPGVDVALCGAVGDDPAGADQLAGLREAGVDVAHVAVRHDVATGVALIEVTPDGENSIVVGTGANATLRDTEVAAACAGAGLVLGQTEVGAGPVDAAAAAARDGGGRLVLSLAPVIDVTRTTLTSADPLVVNESEAAAVVGADLPTDPEDAVRALVAAAGCRSAVLTLGAAGAVVHDGERVESVPPGPVAEVVDTTGAGDVLAGALLAALAAGSDLVEATRRASHAAARAVGVAGAR